MSTCLENSIANVSWLLHVSEDDRGHENLGLPPIAADKPNLYLIWEQVATLYSGSLEERSDAAASLVSLARDNGWYAKRIIDEVGVGPLLKLLKEGNMKGQENAARAIGLLGRDPESVDHLLHAGVCPVFADILKDGPMVVQADVAWAVAQLVANYIKCQDVFAQHNVVTLLATHLAFETLREHSEYDTVMASSNDNSHRVITSTMAMNASHKPGVGNVGKHEQNQNSLMGQPESNNGQSNGKQTYDQPGYSHFGINMKGRDLESHETKARMKAMAAKALWHLAKGNSPICRSVAESRGLLCFAVLLEKGRGDLQYNSAMAVMEITAVAEKDSGLRRSAFKLDSPACKAVVDQVLKIIEKADSELLVPCVKAIGNLARTLRATETWIMAPLVRLLDERDAEVTREACIALTKFACSENCLHLDHSKAIISAGGGKHLVQLVYFGDQIVQVSAVVLLCYIAIHVPDSKELAMAEALAVLEWASKQAFKTQDETIKILLQEAKSRLELYQSRGSRGFH